MDPIRLFWTLSGDDLSIIEKCKFSTRARFTWIGILVFLVFSICFISCYFAFKQLFQNNYIGIPIGIFFSWMITNIYLLLLYTLTKSSLPYAKSKLTRTISVTIRVFFVIFIAIIISKPIESLLFNNRLNFEIDSFKTKKLAEYTLSTEEL
jgi:hypothetical protein